MNSRILGITGSVLIIFSIFLPRVSIFGINISYFDSIKSGSGPEGFIFLGLGVISLILALLNKTRLLIATGILTLGYLTVCFIDYKLTMKEVTRDVSTELTSQLDGLVRLQWGWAMLALGGLLLVVAGIMKKSMPSTVPAYGAPPPPPPPDYAQGLGQSPPYNR
ncbi:MAG TPA: hypothetical protein VF528_19075 [Pyrinomonadaceae bacterium]|jgi:hypothetical protein